MTDKTNVIALTYYNANGQVVSEDVIHLSLLQDMAPIFRTLTIESKIQKLCGIDFITTPKRRGL